MRLLEICFSLVLASGLAQAQTASVQLFGTACPDPLGAGSPSLTVTGVPRLGTSYSVNYSAGPSGRPPQGGSIVPILATGLSSTSAGGVPLPFAIPVNWYVQQPAGCLLLVSAELAQVPPGAGPVTFSVPNVPALAGLALHHQWLVAWIDTFAPSGRRYLLGSNAARAQIGF